MPSAALSLELASGFQYPAEIMTGIVEQMAALPPRKRHEGRATIETLAASIQAPVQSN